MATQPEKVSAGCGPAGLGGAAQRGRGGGARPRPALASLLAAVILNHKTPGRARCRYQLARKLGDQELRAMSLREIAEEAYAADPTLVETAEADLKAVFERDPACKGYRAAVPVLQGLPGAADPARGPLAVERGPRDPGASTCRAGSSELFQVDIHPAARIGRGVFIDHGTGIVIGETAVIGDDVSMLQGVTLGGTGAERGDRHPKIGKGVLLGAGAKVLGNIEIGDYAKIASGSVVLKPVPAGCTAAGVPARLVNCPTCDEPARSMDHTLADAVYDYVI